MTQILGFAGKKQSGKNTACNYIVALKLAELGISKKTRLTDRGAIEVTDIFGETKEDGEWFGFNSQNLNVNKLFDDSLGKFVRIYGLADTLKDLCINILGLEYNQAYGTNKEKNSKTSIRWGTLPHHNNKYKNTQMTAREVLQYVGTDIFRKLDPDIWIKSLLRKIEKDRPEVALICDVRFKNEISRLQEKGGQLYILEVVRLILIGCVLCSTTTNTLWVGVENQERRQTKEPLFIKFLNWPHYAKRLYKKGTKHLKTTK